MTFSFVKHRKIWFVLSGILIVGSIAAIAIFGFNFGIDFTGGSIIELNFQNRPSVEETQTILSAAGYDHSVIQPSGETEMIIRLEALDETAHQAVLSAFEVKDPGVTELQFNSFGPSVGSELRKKTTTGVIVTLLLIGLFIAWSFRKVSDPVKSWKYALITVFAGFHDVIVPLGLFAILGHFFGWQIDTAFVAAALTILGYSINDTIVVFDRTRENLGRFGDEHFGDTVDKSIQQTLFRSVYSSLTTMLALVAIFVWGGETTRPFALALFVGIGIGTYSSIFIASPLLVAWEEWNHRRRA
ncbi:MAG: protein translocase subunit SecF [Patescibacteria group bacterium]|jgi:preprotein translocase subunit SecF